MKIKCLAVIAAVILFCLSADSSAFGQGKGKGGGQGKGQGQGSGKGQGQGQGEGKGQGQGKGEGQGQGQGQGDGKGQGQGKSSDKSSGNSDVVSDVPTKSSDDSPGNSGGKGKGDEQKALHAKQKAGQLTDKELNRYKGLSKKLGTTPEVMRARYEAALLRDPDLTYGNFVSAHMAADNLGGRYPNVTSDAILIGMSRGRSLGQTLQDLKVAPTHSQTTQDVIRSRMRPILGN